MMIGWLAMVALVGSVAGPAAAASPSKLLVISVDGLDWRYLRDRDSLGLAIPTLRQLMAQGETAEGVIGVCPTVTWPSHTSIITGVRPDQHGILGNRRPKAEGGDYYWTADLLQARTLWRCAAEHGLTTAAITWPVTTDAPITYLLPEYFQRRNGGSMDLASIASKATPGLVDAISRMFPSFAQQWMDDRTRTLAVLYLLHEKQPDLILLHLVDLDSEAHDQGPFTDNAKAILERTDELIGQIVAVLPEDYNLVITSDHGFERIDRVANLPVLLHDAGIAGDVQSLGGIATTRDPRVADYLRSQSGRADGDIGREIPRAELLHEAPTLSDAIAAFEPADHVMFGRAGEGPAHTLPREKGDHGFWPLRHDYRSVYILFGPTVLRSTVPEIRMVDLKERLAVRLGIACPP